MTYAADLAIRARRALFNQALASGDLQPIGPLLTLHSILITGTDSALLSGRKAQLLAWKREFSAADRAIYVRTPNSIQISPIEPIALEIGHWESRSAISAVPLATGTYTAKWRNTGTDWQIEAEIYLTLA